MSRPMERIKHKRTNNPICKFFVEELPKSQQTKNKKLKIDFQESVRREAKKSFSQPIPFKFNDVEVEIFWATFDGQNGRGVPKDIDNIIKPILDALKKVVYEDDEQVRAVSARRIDRKGTQELAGFVEDIMELCYPAHRNKVLIAIYSDSFQSIYG